jgi:hypothetical protein
MSKAVTKHRILQALNHVTQFRQAQHERDSLIMHQFMMVGLKTAFVGPDDAQPEIIKLNLELDFWGIPKSEAAIAIIHDRWEQTNDRRCYYQAKIWAIQVHHGISGLEPSETTLGDAIIEHWRPSPRLQLIEADLARLRRDKPRLTKFMLDYGVQQGLDFYQNVDDTWEQTAPAAILAALPFYDWAAVWESERSAHNEVYLSLGKGTNTTTPTSRVDYCACGERPTR